ncbi:MAG: SagB/ThcOx family dehydrogenase [Ignisphaera sp.]|nr:SagB/ThcOx family dehydrogenase [Ignisphaera sp.]MCX8167666.1 SagB/ThcOx family dehydrogenase [Ignisphaera sp.]MDW8085656.1 SagB/ThcOx family dehydrogenase [Ignisphaera sp.]
MVSRYLALAVLLLIVVAIGVAMMLNILITRFIGVEKGPEGVDTYGEIGAGVEPANVTIVFRDNVVLLPYPKIRRGVLSTEEAIAYRRSIRDYADRPISIVQLSQLLWATYGISETRWGLRTTPSAGATYPLEIYVVVGDGRVSLPDGDSLKAGVYRYDPHTHSLALVRAGDFMVELSSAAVNQRWVREAAINVVICAVYERTTRVYGERGYRYVYMEVGHAGQNIYLEATALNLGAVVIGAFYDDWVKGIINAEDYEHPLYIVSVGIPREVYRVSEDEIAEYIDGRRRDRGLVD